MDLFLRLGSQHSKHPLHCQEPRQYAFMYASGIIVLRITILVVEVLTSLAVNLRALRLRVRPEIDPVTCSADRKVPLRLPCGSTESPSYGKRSFLLRLPGVFPPHLFELLDVTDILHDDALAQSATLRDSRGASGVGVDPGKLSP